MPESIGPGLANSHRTDEILRRFSCAAKFAVILGQNICLQNGPANIRTMALPQRVTPWSGGRAFLVRNPFYGRQRQHRFDTRSGLELLGQTLESFSVRAASLKAVGLLSSN